MQSLCLSSQLPFSSSQVFEWLLCYYAVERAFPPWIKVVASLDERGGSSTLAFLVNVGPFFQKIMLKHDQCKGKKRFCDVQIKGPFHKWIHTCQVLSVGGNKCLLEDQIESSSRIPFATRTMGKRLYRALSWRQETVKRDLVVLSRYRSPPLRILVSGSSGLIGRSLIPFLKMAGHSVTRLIRHKGEKGRDTIYWNPEKGVAEKKDFERFDAVIHLAGKSLVGKGLFLRFSPKVKEEIFQSRCRDTWLLSQILRKVVQPPRTFICASAVGIYGNREGETLTEKDPPGAGFLAEVCTQWEKVGGELENQGIRSVSTRFGMVVSGRGGALLKMLPTFRMGLGAVLGSGEQYTPWISIEDVVYGLYHVLMIPNLKGAVNFTSPDFETNASFSRKLAKILHRPLFLKVGRFPLKLFMKELGEDLLLSSIKAQPKKLLDSGYAFVDPLLDDCLKRNVYR